VTLTVLTLKYGTAYGPEYVNRLRAGLLRHTSLPLRMLCMTDDPTGIHRDVEILPLPAEPFATQMEAAMATAPVRGRLKKISLFRRDLVPDHTGPMLVLDLDVIVTGDLAPLMTFAPGKVAMRREWRAKPWQFGHGSVARFDPALHDYLYAYMARDPDAAVALGRGSEQNYTSLNAQRHGDFAAFPDEWIVSFKRDCRPRRPLNLILSPRLPPQARVVCFHGSPKMSEAVGGYRAGPFQTTLRAAWLTDAWGAA
jgi:hypothetical protein